jgi:hypothetical protein
MRFAALATSMMTSAAADRRGQVAVLKQAAAGRHDEICIAARLRH